MVYVNIEVLISVSMELFSRSFSIVFYEKEKLPKRIIVTYDPSMPSWNGFFSRLKVVSLNTCVLDGSHLTNSRDALNIKKYSSISAVQ